MKILQICFRPQIPANDGGAIAMYNITKGWVEQENVDLSLFVINTQKHNTTSEELKKEFGLEEVICSSINTEVNPLGAFLNLFSKESYNISRFDKQSLKDDLAELLNRITFDVIHFEGLFVSPLLETAKKHNPDAVCSLRAHNIEHIIWERQSEQSKGLKKTYLKNLATKLKSYEDAIVKKFDAIIPITEIDASYFKNRSKNIFVNSTGIILTLKESEFKLKPKSAFHLGSLDWAPNIEGLSWFAENIWDKVLTKIPEAQFYVAGKNMSPETKKAISGKNINILGQVDSAIEFITNHGVMVVPLLSGSGMRIKVVEGMANGCPILSTSVGAEGIKVQDNKDILLADSVDEFVDELIELLQNPEKALTLGKEASLTAQHNYSNNKKVRELTDFYLGLI